VITLRPNNGGCHCGVESTMTSLSEKLFRIETKTPKPRWRKEMIGRARVLVCVWCGSTFFRSQRDADLYGRGA